MSKSQDRRIALQREGASMTISEELKPCLFCGAIPLMSAVSDPSGVKIECKCGAGMIADTQELATSLWNRRTFAPIVRGELRQDLVSPEFCEHGIRWHNRCWTCDEKGGVK